MQASQAPQVFGTLFLLIAIAISIVVRGASAALSPRIRSSIALHPVAHFVWLLASVLAGLVLILWLGPHFTNRPPRGATQRPEVDAGQRVQFAFVRTESTSAQAEYWAARSSDTL